LALVDALASTFPASSRAFRFDPALLRETISEMVYPARLSSKVSAVPSLPGPTIAIRGFAAIAAAYQHGSTGGKTSTPASLTGHTSPRLYC
jgi:hypothetical protein